MLFVEIFILICSGAIGIMVLSCLKLQASTNTDVQTGSTVRYGPNRLLVNTATSLHGTSTPITDIINSDLTIVLHVLDIYDHSKPMKKSKAFATVSRYIGGQSLLTLIDKTLHRNRRRSYNPGFSPEALSNFEPTMISHIRIFCEQLVKKTTNVEGEWTEPKNVKDLCKLHCVAISVLSNYHWQAIGSHSMLVATLCLVKISKLWLPLRTGS